MASSTSSTDPSTQLPTTLDALSSVPIPSQTTAKHSLADLTAITDPSKIPSINNTLSLHVETGSHDLNTNSASNNLAQITNSDLIKGIIKANARVDGLDPLQLEYSTAVSEVTPIFDVVSNLKTTETQYAARLYELTEKYSHVRTFSKSQQNVFLALAFAFFEQFFLKGPQVARYEDLYPLLVKILNQDIETSMGALKFAYRELISGIKELIRDGELNKGSRLYESMCYSSGGYEATLILFMQILIESLKESNVLVPANLQTETVPSFKWMNNVPLSDERFYQSISQILNASLNVIVLTPTQTEQKTFVHQDLAPVTAKEHLAEVVLLINQRDWTSYLLYTSKEQRKSSDTTTRRLVKQPSTFSFLKTLQRKSTIKVGSPMHLKTPTVRGEKRRGSFLLLSGEEQAETEETINFSSESYQKKKQKEEFIQSLPAREGEIKNNSYIIVDDDAKVLLQKALKNIKVQVEETKEQPKPKEDSTVENATVEKVAEVTEEVKSNIQEVLDNISKKEQAAIPMMIKEKFIMYNIEVQKHEMELRGITERYISEKSDETEKKVLKENISAVKKKYEEIMQQKKLSESEEDTEEFSGGGGMRMDS